MKVLIFPALLAVAIATAPPKAPKNSHQKASAPSADLTAPCAAHATSNGAYAATETNRAACPTAALANQKSTTSGAAFTRR